jgi:hypothetical protein
MDKIQEKINDELIKIEYIQSIPLTDNQLDMIYDALAKIDSDLKPIILLFCSLVKNLSDPKIKTLYTMQFLKYYGINNTDILTIRPKYVIKEKKLVKIPFLKINQKESINILLEELGINVTNTKKQL